MPDDEICCPPDVFFAKKKKKNYNHPHNIIHTAYDLANWASSVLENQTFYSLFKIMKTF